MTTTQTVDGRAEWVERHIGKELTPFQRDAVMLLCIAMRCGPYDFPRTFENAVWQFGKGVRFTVRNTFSTFDTDGLTALVLGAHDLAIRVEIGASNPTHLSIAMHPRERWHRSQWGRHPSIHQVLAGRRTLDGHRNVSEEAA